MWQLASALNEAEVIVTGWSEAFLLERRAQHRDGKGRVYKTSGSTTPMKTVLHLLHL